MWTTEPELRSTCCANARTEAAEIAARTTRRRQFIQSDLFATCDGPRMAGHAFLVQSPIGRAAVATGIPLLVVPSSRFTFAK